MIKISCTFNLKTLFLLLVGVFISNSFFIAKQSLAQSPDSKNSTLQMNAALLIKEKIIHIQILKKNNEPRLVYGPDWPKDCDRKPAKPSKQKDGNWNFDLNLGENCKTTLTLMLQKKQNLSKTFEIGQLITHTDPSSGKTSYDICYTCLMNPNNPIMSSTQQNNLNDLNATTEAINAAGNLMLSEKSEDQNINFKTERQIIDAPNPNDILSSQEFSMIHTITDGPNKVSYVISSETRPVKQGGQSLVPSGAKLSINFSF